MEANPNLDEQAEKLIKDILEYADTSVVPTLPMELAIAFSFIRSTMDRDAEKWNKTRTQRAEAGRKGGVFYWDALIGQPSIYTDFQEQNSSTQKQ